MGANEHHPLFPPPPPPYLSRASPVYPNLNASNISLYRGGPPYYTSNTNILSQPTCTPPPQHPPSVSPHLNFNLLLQKPFLNNECTASTLPLRKRYDTDFRQESPLSRHSSTYLEANEFPPSTPPMRRCEASTPVRCDGGQPPEFIRYYSYTLPRLRQYYDSPGHERATRPKSYYFYDNVQAFDAGVLGPNNPKFYYPKPVHHTYVPQPEMAIEEEAVEVSRPIEGEDLAKMYPILPNLSVKRHFPIPEYSKTYIQNSRPNQHE